MAAHYGWKVKNRFTSCDDCMLAKSRQKDVSKKPGEHSDTPGYRLMIDTTSVRKPSLGGAKFWLVVMDDNSDFLWSFFLKRKSDQVDVMMKLLQDLKAK